MSASRITHAGRIVVAVLATAVLALAAGTAGASTWTVDGGGNWSTPGNWDAGVPNGQDAVADLNPAGGISTTRMVVPDIAVTVGALTMDDASSPYNNWTINGGSFGLTFDASGGTANLTVDRGSDNQINRPVTFASDLAVTLNNASQLTVTNLILGSGALSLSGDGLLFLSYWGGANTYSGGVTINGGVLKAAADNSLGASGDITCNGGTLQWGGSFALNAARTITLGVAGGTLDNNGMNTTIPGKITGSGPLSYVGSRAVTLSGTTSDYTGPTSIGSGTLVIAMNNSVLGATASGTAIQDGGELWLRDLGAYAEPLTIAGAGATGNANGSYAALVSYTGANTLSAPIALAGDASIRGAVHGGSSLTLTGGIDAPVPRTVSIISTTINSTGLGANVSLVGDGGIVVVNVASAHASTTVNAGTVRVNATQTGDGLITINSGGAFEANADNAMGSAATGTIVQDGGRLHFGATMNYTNEEPVTVAGNGPDGTGAIRCYTATVNFPGPITLSDDARIYHFHGGSLTLSGAVDAPAPAALTLSGGTIRIDTIGLGPNIWLETNGAITLAVDGEQEATTVLGSVLSITAAQSGDGPITVVSGATLEPQVDNAMGSTVGGTFVEAGGRIHFRYPLTYTNAEPVTIAGDGPDGTGAIRSYSGGAMSFPGPISLAADAAVRVQHGGSLTLTGGVTAAAPQTLALQSYQPLTIRTNGMGPNVSLHQSAGAYLTTIDVASNYADTTVDDGTFTVTAIGSLGSGALTVNQTDATVTTVNLNNASQATGSLSGTGNTLINLNLSGSHALTVVQTVAGEYPGVIAGSNGALTLGAASTAALTLSGTNTYGGGTTVAGGTLLVTGSIAGTAAVTAGGTLGGTGSIGGAVAVAAGGTVAPGVSPGVLTLNDGLDMAADSILAIEIDGAQSDKLVVTGAVTLAGTLDLIQLSAPSAGSYVIIDNDGTDPVSGTFAGLPEGSQVLDDLGQKYQITYIGGSDNNDVVLTPLFCDCEAAQTAAVAAACTALTEGAPSGLAEALAIINDVADMALAANGCALDDPCRAEILALFGF